MTKWATALRLYLNMKINYKTHKPLSHLENGTLGTVPMPMPDASHFLEDREPLIALNDAFKRHCHKIREKIYYVSQPFYDAQAKAFDRLSNLYVDMMKEDRSDFSFSGVFIIMDKVIFFHNEFKANSDFFEAFYAAFDKNGAILEFFVSNFETNKDVYGWAYSQGPLLDALEKGYDLRGYLQNNMINTSVIVMFMKYAEVETKTVFPNKKRRFGDPYRNDTMFPITHLNSKWFTNIVKSESFKVRGHFRLQPKKVNGEWTKELIWINEFEKSGYVSKAKMLNQ